MEKIGKLDAPAEFGMETTGHYWLPLYAHLRQAKQTVHVINPLQSDALRNMFIRQTKNDTIDALIVAEVILVAIVKRKLPPKISLLCVNSVVNVFSSSIWRVT